MNMNMLIGYTRISHIDSSVQMQIEALEKAGCKKIFQENAISIKTKLTQLEKAFEYMRDGEDTLVIYELYRLGRSLKDIVAAVENLEKRNIKLKVLENKIDTSTPEGKGFFKNISITLNKFHQESNTKMKDIGYEVAKEQNRIKGRPVTMTEAKNKRFLSS